MAKLDRIRKEWQKFFSEQIKRLAEDRHLKIESKRVSARNLCNPTLGLINRDMIGAQQCKSFFRN